MRSIPTQTDEIGLVETSIQCEQIRICDKLIQTSDLMSSEFISYYHIIISLLPLSLRIESKDKLTEHRKTSSVQ